MPHPSANCTVTSTMRSFVCFCTLHMSISYKHIHTNTHSHTHKPCGTGWVCLYKHSRFLLISNLSEFCPTACVSTRVRDHTTGCQCLSCRLVIPHSLIISLLRPLHLSAHPLCIHETQVNKHSTVLKQPVSASGCSTPPAAFEVSFMQLHLRFCCCAFCRFLSTNSALPSTPKSPESTSWMTTWTISQMTSRLSKTR